MGDHGQCLACKFLRRPCSEGCPYIQLFSTYFDVPSFQIENAASTADRQKIEARITDSTRIFEANAGANEPLFGATGVLLALHQEVIRLETITDEGVNVTPEGTMNHFVLKDSEKIEQQHRACPACTYLPQKCKVDCPFVRFFDAYESKDFIREFYTVLCGSTAVLPDHPNLQAADEWNKAGITAKALEFERKARVHDPLYGTTGIILSLYKNWWNLNHHVRFLEQRHRNVQNFPTVRNGSCNIPTDKGKGIVTSESTNECREDVLKNCLQEVALNSSPLSSVPQEWNYSLCLQQGESSNSSPLRSVPHQMNQPSADPHRVPQQEELLSQTWGPPVRGIIPRISENIPQNVPSQLQQQLAAPSRSQQTASSSLREAHSSQQGMSSSTGGALHTSWQQRQQQQAELLRQPCRRLRGRLPIQDIHQRISEIVPQNVPSHLQQLEVPSHGQQATSSSFRVATSSQQGMSSTKGETINRACQNLTRQEREELLRQTWRPPVQGIIPSQLQRQLAAPSHSQQTASSSLREAPSSQQGMSSSTGGALHTFWQQMQQHQAELLRQPCRRLRDRPPIQEIHQRISEIVPQHVPSQLQQQLAAPSHGQQATSSSLRVATSSQQGISSTTGEAINRAWQNLTRQEREELLRQTWRGLPYTSHVQNLLQQISQRVPRSVALQLQQQSAAPSYSQQASSSSFRAATSSRQGTSSSTGTPPTSTTDTI